MSKSDSWMPFYVGDYLADTMKLTTLQHGAYFLLLCDYWKNGPLADDDAELAAIAKLDQKAWRAISGSIRRFFTVGSDGLLHQKRMDAERCRSSEISDQRRAKRDTDAERLRRWRASKNGHPTHDETRFETQPETPTETVGETRRETQNETRFVARTTTTDTGTKSTVRKESKIINLNNTSFRDLGSARGQESAETAPTELKANPKAVANIVGTVSRKLAAKPLYQEPKRDKWEQIDEVLKPSTDELTERDPPPDWRSGARQAVRTPEEQIRELLKDAPQPELEKALRRLEANPYRDTA